MYMGIKRNLPFFIYVSLAALLLCSCVSAEARLTPPQPAGEYRLNDIDKAVSEDPVKAVHLIGIYRTLYREDIEEDDSGEIESRLTDYHDRAVSAIRDSQLSAIEEKRWDDAASLARSLSVLGIDVERTGMEPDFVLADAKEQLEAGNDLAAFLGAVRVHELKALEAEDALLFLERAFALKQRRTAAFFLSIIDNYGSGSVPAVDAELRAFAAGQDTASDMIKGVATVWVDRGYTIRRGMGTPDRVIGSAFFVDASGLLITNYHVIASEVDPKYEGYSRLYIRLGDSASARIPAKVIGYDKAMDLALIKAEVSPEYVFSIVDRVIPRVGDTVYAIGSPGGLEKTVTSGIVSALGRRFLQIGDVIQIDAAVNHGNSGGPVVDHNGRLVGIVYAGVESYQGLNFAVPAERLAAALPAMIDGGKAQRPWLGLSISESTEGAEIIYVAPLTPAGEQQIKEGKFISAINGQHISAPQGALIPAYQDALFSSRPGELVSLETSDGETRIMMSVVRPDVPLAEAAKADSRERLAAPLFGLILAPSLGKSFSPSYLVKKVVRGSIADEAGLSEHDPVSIKGFRIDEEAGIALLDITVKKRRLGYLETTMRLPALLDSPDTL